MALASHCTNVPEGSMWNLRGQGVTTCTPSHPGLPQELSHQPPRAPCTAGAGIHPQELPGWQLPHRHCPLSSENHFPLDFPPYPFFFFFNKFSKFSLLEGRPDWSGSAKPFPLPVGPFGAQSSGYSCSNTSPRNVTWIMLLVALPVL